MQTLLFAEIRSEILILFPLIKINLENNKKRSVQKSAFIA